MKAQLEALLNQRAQRKLLLTHRELFPTRCVRFTDLGLNVVEVRLHPSGFADDAVFPVFVQAKERTLEDGVEGKTFDGHAVGREPEAVYQVVGMVGSDGRNFELRQPQSVFLGLKGSRSRGLARRGDRQYQQAYRGKP